MKPNEIENWFTRWERVIKSIPRRSREHTFTLDPYKGWTIAQLKRRCRELCHAMSNDEMIILKLAERGIDGLSPDQRQRVERLIQAYED